MQTVPLAVLLTVCVAVVSLFVPACSGDASPPGGTTTGGSTGTGPAAPSTGDIRALTASIAGGGSSFVDAFAQAVNADFNAISGREIVTYAKSGSADGRKQLATRTLDFAGTDSAAKPTESFQGGPVLYFPSVAAPITVSFHLNGIEELRLRPDTLAGIFSARITTWDDPAVVADNPGVHLPARPIVVVHRSDGSGTTANFTSYLAKASPAVWTIGAGDTVNWPAGTQGAEKNSGVATVIAQTDGAIGYVDLADAIKADLAFASIRNRDGHFVGPTAKGTAAAVEHATVRDDLTYDPLDAPGADTYPLTAPTYFLAYRDQVDARQAETLRTWLAYMLSTGQSQALPLGYVGLSDTLRQRASAQIAEIVG